MPPRKRYDKRKAVKRIARQRVGAVPASRVIEPKPSRKPRHKRPPGEDE